MVGGSRAPSPIGPKSILRCSVPAQSWASGGGHAPSTADPSPGAAGGNRGGPGVATFRLPPRSSPTPPPTLAHSNQDTERDGPLRIQPAGELPALRQHDPGADQPPDLHQGVWRAGPPVGTTRCLPPPTRPARRSSTCTLRLLRLKHAPAWPPWSGGSAGWGWGRAAALFYFAFR